MKKAGIIAEYNPFHKGHKYHIEKTREHTGAEAIVAVMSGSFVQRGDAAVCDKYTRAKMALFGGADLVLELPCVFSAQSAEIFARGGVGILEAVGCDFLSFGTESENIDELKAIADLFKNSKSDIDYKIGELISEGISYPRAISNVLGDMGYSAVMDSPNNILGIEYLKANRSMTPVGVMRQGSLHDDVGSASDVRGRIYGGEDFENLIPESTGNLLVDTKIADKKVLEKLVLYKLRTMTAAELKNVPDVTEGLENRILECALKADSLECLCEMIKTKRYTMARIRRILINAMIGITKEDVKEKPQYIRVIGMNEIGAMVLKEIKNIEGISVITKTADAKMCRMLSLDIRASDIYSLLTGVRGGQDFINSPVVIK